MLCAHVCGRHPEPRLGAILLRESYREAGKTKNRTLANLSRWPAERIKQLRAGLRGKGEPLPVRSFRTLLGVTPDA